MSGSRLAALHPFEEKKDYLDMRVKNGIEQHRKGFHTLHVVDAQGQPIPGARISLKQKSHDFFFGANLFMLGQLADEQRQRDYERAFCHLFNMATLPFYWNGLEPEQGGCASRPTASRFTAGRRSTCAWTSAISTALRPRRTA